MTEVGALRKLVAHSLLDTPQRGRAIDAMVVCMRVLVPIRGDAYAAHLLDAQNRPLCKAILNLALWVIRDLEAAEYRILCGNCKRRQGRTNVE